MLSLKRSGWFESSVSLQLSLLSGLPLPWYLWCFPTSVNGFCNLYLIEICNWMSKGMQDCIGFIFLFSAWSRKIAPPPLPIKCKSAENQWHLSLKRYSAFQPAVTLGNGIKLRQDLYLSMRKLSNLSRSFAFGNLSRGIFFSVDLFFRRGRPMNITGAVAGKPSIPSHKNCTVLNCFKHTFSVNNHAIVSSRHVCFANWLFWSSRYVRTQILRGQKTLWSLL